MTGTPAKHHKDIPFEWRLKNWPKYLLAKKGKILFGILQKKKFFIYILKIWIPSDDDLVDVETCSTLNEGDKNWQRKVKYFWNFTKKKYFIF
jgi:hypothetical protein